MGSKFATVAIVGRTNAGKSTLLNALVGEKVSIVSPTVQTTRNTIRAILDEKRGQLVFLDTPGIHKAEGNFGKILNRMARRTAAGADITLRVIDSSAPATGENAADFSQENAAETIVVFNKVDIAPREESAAELCVSAKTGRGIDKLLDTLFERAPEGPRMFDPSIISDYPRRLAIADVVREKFLPLLKKEVPHDLGMIVEDFKEDGRTWRVSVSILVNRPSQKPIVIGPRGKNVHKVQEQAGAELAEQYGVHVELKLWVKVSPNWAENPQILKQMGYYGNNV